MLKLEFEHPHVAFRSCASCRKYFYDEKTGEIREGKAGKLRRTNPPPCENPYDSCPKGHWKAPIEMHRRFLPIMQLYEQVKATSGGCLTEAEKRDPVCQYALAKIAQVDNSISEARAASRISSAVIAAQVIQ